MRLFRGLVSSHPREEFELLAEKLQQRENAPIPRVNFSITRLMVEVRTRQIEDLLSSLGDSAQAPLDTRLVIEGTMGHLRRDVFLMSFELLPFKLRPANSSTTRSLVTLVPLLTICSVKEAEPFLPVANFMSLIAQ